MAFFLRRNIAALDGYSPGEQPQDANIIKLNTNENPYPPSPRVLTALRKAANHSLRLYPEPLADSLRAKVAAIYRVNPINVLAGNGSDELLTIIARCVVGQGDRVVYSVPTYSLYDTLVAIQEGERVAIPYPDDFSLPEALYSQKGALTLLCNPNSPSGTLTPLDQVERLAQSVAGLLVVDEAYIDFADGEGHSALPLINRYPNLVVLRTFSKSFSLAGMRIGLAFAAEDVIRGMLKVKDSYNMSRLSLVSAMAALEDFPWMQRNVAKIQSTRKRLTAALKRLGLTVHPSQANFVMARESGTELKGIFQELKKRGILVRYFDVPGLRDALRISVGTPKEISSLIREMSTLLKP